MDLDADLDVLFKDPAQNTSQFYTPNFFSLRFEQDKINNNDSFEEENA